MSALAPQAAQKRTFPNCRFVPEAVIPAPCIVRSTRCTRAVVARRWKAHVPGRRHGSNLILKKLIFHPVLTHASRRAHHVRVAHRKNVGRKSSHEGLVSHRSAVRSRDLRNDPHLSASNATWCRTERRSSASCHLPACSCDGAAGGKTRISVRATCLPPRLLNPVRTPTPLQRSASRFGGRFDPAEWRTAAEQSDHWKRTLRPRHERPRSRRPAEERYELAPLHVWMAPAWQEIIWRAAQRSLAVMCPACWCSPAGLLALMGCANRVLIIRTGSMSR